MPNPSSSISYSVMAERKDACTHPPIWPWKTLGSKVVMVTGASSGIGREICLDLARVGCRIVAAARRIDRTRSLCEEINGTGGGERPSVRAVAVQLDLEKKGAEVDAAVERAWGAFGRIDALVNNAGVRGNVSSPLDLFDEEWNHVLATNLTGTWLVTKYVCKRMRDANQKGSVINISSISGLNRGQLPGGIAYSVSKAGINIMTVDMALELGEHNIRVNSISPGLFKSEITSGLLQKAWLNDVVKRIYPLQTYGDSNPAITSLVRYLIDDSSDYISGNIFIVDVGATLPGIPIFSSL